MIDAGDWGPTEMVECVTCPWCAFQFGAEHEDIGGGWSCPACNSGNYTPPKPTTPGSLTDH